MRTFISLWSLSFFFFAFFSIYLISVYPLFVVVVVLVIGHKRLTSFAVLYTVLQLLRHKHTHCKLNVFCIKSVYAIFISVINTHA